MVYVPAGEFIMGSSDVEVASARDLCDGVHSDCRTYWVESEYPQRTVYLDAFYTDKTEVTNADFARFVKETGYQTEHEKYYGGLGWRDYAESKDNHPVVMVSWNDADAYCQWAGKRLPREAEWEKAARGTDARVYPWGNVFDGSKVNFCDKNCPETWKDASVDDGYADTAPVGSYPAGASPYGALDMAGNVGEWTADQFEKVTGRDIHAVVRGGRWYNAPDGVRCASRKSARANASGLEVGFRCIKDAEQGSTTDREN
jgi:formylglycine-generating enzyme required for sulfatase activity